MSLERPTPSTLCDQALAASQGLRFILVVHDVHIQVVRIKHENVLSDEGCQPPEIRAHSREKPSITSHASFFVPLSRMS